MSSRRAFLANVPVVLAAGLAACKDEPGRAEVGPTEDLMREHGVLDRVLIVYEEGARRLDAAETGWAVDALAQAARLVRKFLEDYHEKSEEELVFPRLEKGQRLGDVIEILRAQHAAGRPITDRIERAAVPQSLVSPDARRGLAGDMRAFARMMRPHDAREATIIFPAFRKLLSPKELDEIGEQMEEREKTALGNGGFQNIVAEVATIERTLGVDDLAKFTPGYLPPPVPR